MRAYLVPFRPRFWLVLVPALLAPACMPMGQEPDPDENKTAPPEQRAAFVPVAVLPGAARVGLPDELLAHPLLGSRDGTPLLPKWKTSRESALERAFIVARAKGLVHIDASDTYRQQNIDKFYPTKAPAAAGIRLPAEYEPSQAYLLSWLTSYSSSDWKKLFGEIVKGAWGVVPVLLTYKDAAHKTFLENQLKALGYTTADLADPTKVLWFLHDNNGIWARDFGPLSIVTTPTSGQGTLSFVDFRYYHARHLDDVIPTNLAQSWGINVFRPDMDLEGGNFMATADGLCASTRAVLWYNLQLSQSAVEKIYADYLGCKKVLLPMPMTGGVIAHIDMFSKLASDTSIIMGEYTASQHAANKAILDANAALWAKTTNGAGNPITVTRIPMPDVGTIYVVYKVWRTYTNSLALSNGTQKVLLIPTYSDETSTESQAMAVYAQAFPGWTLVKIDSKIIIPLQGAIHCITMQIPAGTKAKMETDPADLCGAKVLKCAPSGCGGISAKGCCDGELLKYCSGSSLKATECFMSPKCGWDSTKGLYGCTTGGSPDPSATYPMSCTAASDAAVPDSGPDQGPAADAGVPDRTRPDAGMPDRARDGLPAGTDGAGPSDEEAGCDCTAAGGTTAAGWLLPLVLLFVLLAVRSGRRRRQGDDSLAEINAIERV